MSEKWTVSQLASVARDREPPGTFDGFTDDQVAHVYLDHHRELVPHVDLRTIKPSNAYPMSGADYDFSTSGAEQGVAVGLKRGAEAVHSAAIGAGKRAIETGYVLGRGVVNAFKNQPADTPISADFEDAIKRKNPFEKLGAGVETGIELAGGEGVANVAGKMLMQAPKAASAMAAAPRLLGTVGKIAKGAAVGAGVTAAEGGDRAEVATNAAVGGFLPVVMEGAGAGLAKFGRKLQSTIVRPALQDVRDGFNAANIEKYNVGGSLRDMASKTHEAITSRAAQLQEKLHADPSAQVDVLGALADAERELMQNRAQFFGKNRLMASKVKELTAELGDIAPNGVVDLATAQQIKRATGNLGAWQYGSRDPEATAMEKVANVFYTKLRGAIEKASPPGVQQINKEIGDLIPIENAIIRRIPVDERNNVLNLGKIVAIANGDFRLLGAEMALKSGHVASGAIKAGRALQVPAAQRGLAAAVISANRNASDDDDQ